MAASKHQKHVCQVAAIKVVKEIIRDLTGRKGLDAMWEEIDEDIRDEIENDWIESTRKVIEGEFLE